MHAALATSVRTITERDQRLEEAALACDRLANEGQLTGEAWQAVKRQAETTGQKISATLDYDRAILGDHAALSRMLDQYIEDDFIAEDAIVQAQDRLRQVGRIIEIAQELLPPVTRALLSPNLNNLLARDRKTNAWLQQKIDRLHEFDQATAGLYGGQNGYGDTGNLHDHQWWQFWEHDDSSLDWSETVESGIVANDPLVAGELRQSGIGDCWLLSTINAMIDAGMDDELRAGIQDHTDEKPPYYLVRIYDDGKPVWVKVSQVPLNGVGVMGLSGNQYMLDRNGNKWFNGGQSIASLYEAAIEDQFKNGALNGNNPDSAWEAITGRKPLKTGGDPGNEAMESQGSMPTNVERRIGKGEGTISVAGSKPAPLCWPWQKTEEYSGSIQAKISPEASGSGTVEIVYNHAYEVVDARGGMVALRNPWGQGNQADGKFSDQNNGVFWISKSDFDRMFDSESRQ